MLAGVPVTCPFYGPVVGVGFAFRSTDEPEPERRLR